MLLSATILMGTTATPALAQTAPAATPQPPAPQDTIDNGSNNDIVVTGSRRTTTLQDAPINISAVSSETLAKERIDDVRGIAAFTPGVTVTDTGPATTGNIILRGISSGDTGTNENANNTIGVYLGEIPLYLDFKLIDLERVEVLEGPQGTLYGLGTLAGAVRYIPNRPTTDRFSVDLHARGYFETHSSDLGGVGDVAVNVPLVRDHIAFRTATGYYDNAGFVDDNYVLRQPGISNPQPTRSTDPAQSSLADPNYGQDFRRVKDINYEHTFTTRNQLLLEYNPNIKAYLTYAHQNTQTDGRQVNIDGVLGTGRYDAAFRYEEPFKRNSDLFAGELYINIFKIAQLVSTTAYTDQTLRNTEDNTDLLLDLNYGYEAFPQFSSYANNHTRNQQWDQEERLISTHGGPFSWVLGGFYNRQKQEADRHEYTPGFAQFEGIPRPDNLEYVSSSHTRLEEYAAYGEGTLHITKAWQVTGGVRYFKYNLDTIGGQALPLIGVGIADYPSTTINPNRFTPGKAGDDGVVYKANTSYKFSENLLAYATYSTGYRVGGANRVVACTPQDLQRAAMGGQVLCALPNELFYGPDKTRNAEIGVRASLFDKRVQFTLDGFHVDWTDIQVPSQTIFGAIGITKNAGKAVSQGFEFTGLVKVTPRLVLQGTYAYTDAHLTSHAHKLVVVQDANGLIPSDNPPGAQIDGEPGDRLPGSTKNSGSAQATYTYPLGQGRSIQANWTATYTGDIYSRVGLLGFGTDIPGYVTHRASLTYGTRAFEASFFADNIFDKYAVTSVGNDLSSFDRIRDAFGSVAGQGVVERFYTQTVLTPRRVGIDLRFHY